MTLPKHYLDQIKSFEGYHSKPYWDYKQWTSGYGTRAAGPDDAIDQAEAERRLQTEILNASQLVDRFAPGLDEGTRAALTSLTYNAGGDWMQSGLGQAVKSGDPAAVRERFAQYVNAGGKPLPGLVKRRQAEAAWMDGASSPMPFSLASVPDQMQEGPEPAAPKPVKTGTPMPFGLSLSASNKPIEFPELPTGSALPTSARNPIDMTRLAAFAAERRKLGV